MGRGLLYAEPIYLQSERSPMPELRIVVLALQDRLSYGPTFEAAMAGLFGQAVPETPAQQAGTAGQAGRGAAAAPPDNAALINGAARDLADYQRLTAEGKLGEAGQRLDSLKQKLDQLQRAQRK